MHNIYLACASTRPIHLPLCLYLSIQPASQQSTVPIHPSTHPPIHPSTHPPIHPSTHPPIHPSARGHALSRVTQPCMFEPQPTHSSEESRARAWEWPATRGGEIDR